MDLNNYTLHSGGAIGSDYAWGYVGSLYGLRNIRHYYYGVRTPYGNVHISEEEFKYGVEAVRHANLFLQRYGYERYLNLLARNWVQVYNSQAIYAITNDLLSNSTIVKGGTGWAVQMAINRGIKDIYVFHQRLDKWVKCDYDSKQFLIFDDVPVLKTSFAGIGTRELKPNGLQAIIDVYNKATKEPTLFD